MTELSVEQQKEFDARSTQRVNKLLLACSDKINSMDYMLKRDFNVPITIARRWTRGQPYPTTMLDALQAMRTLKTEWDEKAGLYETLENYGVEFAISELAHAMGVSIDE